MKFLGLGLNCQSSTLFFFYLFAIVGVTNFGTNDPWHFGSLHVAFLTLFRMSTLEDWTDIMYINMYGCVEYGYEIASMARLCNATDTYGDAAYIARSDSAASPGSAASNGKSVW